jgi:hypothetical protein
MKRTKGGEDRVSVVKMPPWSWRPKPLRGSPQSTTSVVSVCTICPPGPTVLEASDTVGQMGLALSGPLSGLPELPTPSPCEVLKPERQVHESQCHLGWGQIITFSALVFSSVQWGHDSYLGGEGL